MDCNYLINANFITMDPKMPKANWMAVDSGKIVYIGEKEPKGYNAEITMNLSQKTILPGFIDSHVHGSASGIYLSSVVLKDAKSIAEVLELIEERCKSAGNELVIGMDITGEDLKEGRMPYMWELDEVSHGKDVFINHKTLHGSTCNSSVWSKLPILESMPGIDRLNGRITGVLTDDIPYEAAYKYMLKCMDKKTWLSNSIELSRYAFSKGVTAIHSLNGGTEPNDHIDIKVILDHKSEIPLHMVPYIEDFDISMAKEYNLKQAGGCLCLDGSRLVHTAALFEPYADRPELRGPLYFTDDVVYQFVHSAHINNMQTAMHAGGERAIDQLIYTIRRVIMEEGGHNDLRHRIEHFSLPTEEQINMAAELGIICSMQPAFPLAWDIPGNSLYEKFFGKERARRFEPLAKIIKAGVAVCAGSDSPVTEINPLKAIDYCVNTEEENRRIPLYDALKIFTINGTYAGHEENERGSLSIGKFAD